MSDRDSAVTTGVAIPDARQAGDEAQAGPPARMRRVTVTGVDPSDDSGPPMADAAALAADGAYVLLTLPAETPGAVTSATPVGRGVVRTLRVPVDAERTAEVTAAQAAVTALEGGGTWRRVRRFAARRRLESVRREHRATAAAEADEWRERCARAYEPYLSAFAGDGATPPAPGHPVLGIGPVNTAGQGHAWARAVERRHPGIRAEAYTLTSRNTHGHPTDSAMGTGDWLSTRWQLGRLAHVLDTYTHVLAESAMPVFGSLDGARIDAELAELRAAHIAVGLVLYGSEVRDPAAHRARVRFSPFDPRHEMTHALQGRVDRLLPMLRDLDVPKFVITPDLLADVPGSVWLPAIVDPDAWAADTPLFRRPRPVVVHPFEGPFLKGTAMIEPELRRLHDAGLIEYRRLPGGPVAELAEAYAQADIVLDQFASGSYGMTSCQSMAAGRLTVCYLDDEVRRHLPPDVPIVRADPVTLGTVLERIVADPGPARAIAARGPRYVREHHDGRRSAEVLSAFLGVPAPPRPAPKTAVRPPVQGAPAPRPAQATSVSRPVQGAPTPRPVREAPAPRPVQGAPAPRPVQGAPAPPAAREAPAPDAVREAPAPPAAREAAPASPAVREAPAPDAAREAAPTPPAAREAAPAPRAGGGAASGKARPDAFPGAAKD